MSPPLVGYLARLESAGSAGPLQSGEEYQAPQKTPAPCAHPLAYQVCSDRGDRIVRDRFALDRKQHEPTQQQDTSKSASTGHSGGPL